MEKSETPACILIIDDMVSVLKFLEVILKKQGYRVIQANGGEEGLQAYYDHQDELDLVLLDLQMPVMTGFEIAKRIREQDQKIPILAQTALSRDENRIEAMEAGCTDIVLKPIDMTQLISMVREYLGES
jgi:two-component system, cell cycle response regulator DivK